MQTLINFIPTLQIILSVLLIILILLQNSGESLGGAFGGGDDSMDTAKKTRRGSEKTLFNATIIIAVLFTLFSILAVILK